jgi:hypothetical protein
MRIGVHSVAEVPPASDAVPRKHGVLGSRNAVRMPDSWILAVHHIGSRDGVNGDCCERALLLRDGVVPRE